MKKERKTIFLNLSPKAMNQLIKRSQTQGKSRTRYLEDFLTRKERLNTKQREAIKEVIKIIEINNMLFKHINSATSNLNQLTYSLYINNLPKSEEILDVIDLTKQCILENQQMNREILNILKRIAPKKINSKKDTQ